MRLVVALGGNAILDGEGFQGQVEAVERTCREVASVVEDGHEVVVTHGNGPQVGDLLLQQDAADVDRRPLDVLVAETQGQIGYLLQRELDEALEASTAVTLVTQVEVEAEDPAFDDPVKPVGPWYTETEAEERGFEVAEVGDGERRFRRVVPSPRPVEVVEADAVGDVVDSGYTAVCAGGGGIPVVPEDGGYSGVEAVVDKDRTSALLASEVEADAVVFLTDVPEVYLSYGGDDQRGMDEASTEELREHLGNDEFGEGTMKPKVESCVRFVEETGGEAFVAGLGDLEAALDGEAGTQVVSRGER